jgi:hypothetical protein
MGCDGGVNPGSVRSLIQPEIDGAPDVLGTEWEWDGGAEACGLVPGEQDFLNDTTVFAGGLGCILAADASGEVTHFLGESVVPEFLEDGVGPAFGGWGLFDGVAVAVFAVSGQGVAHVEIGVGDAAFAVDLDAIFHAAAAGPAVLDLALGAVVEVEDTDAVIFAAGFVSVYVGAHMAENAPDFGSAEEPVTEGDAVTSHVHKNAAAGAIDIPEPGGVRAEVFLGLFDEVDLAESAFVGHLFGFDVLRGKEQFLSVEKEDALAPAGVDHEIGFLEGHAERFLADHMFAGVGGVDGHLGVQCVGGGDGDQLDVGFGEHLAVIGEPAGQVMFAGELFGVTGGGRRHGNDLGFVGQDAERFGVDIGFELGSDDADFDSTWMGHGLDSSRIRSPVQHIRSAGGAGQVANR